MLAAFLTVGDAPSTVGALKQSGLTGSNMAKDKCAAKATEEPDPPSAARYALVFDLEDAVLPMRQAEYEALRHICDSHKAAMTPELFRRYCLERQPRDYLPELLTALGLRTNDVPSQASDVTDGIAMFLSSPEVELNPFVVALLEVAPSHSISVYLRTRQAVDQARTLLDRCRQMPANWSLLASDTGGRSLVSVGAWLSAVATLEQTASHCIAVVGSQPQLQAALAAGMRAIVVPDRFTAFQEFSGADCVIDDPDDWDPATVLAWWS